MVCPFQSCNNICLTGSSTYHVDSDYPPHGSYGRGHQYEHNRGPGRGSRDYRSRGASGAHVKPDEFKEPDPGEYPFQIYMR